MSSRKLDMTRFYEKNSHLGTGLYEEMSMWLTIGINVAMIADKIIPMMGEASNDYATPA